MKRSFALLLAVLMSGIGSTVSASSQTQTGNSYDFLRAGLFMLLPLSGVLIVASAVLGAFMLRLGRDADHRSNHIGLRLTTIITLIATVIVIIMTVFVTSYYVRISTGDVSSSDMTLTESSQQTPSSVPETVVSTPDPVVPSEPTPSYTPSSTHSSNPKNWSVNWNIIHNNAVVGSYSRPEKLFFGIGSEYTALQGITTFRGNNWRNGATFGTANVVNRALSEKWRKSIGALEWTGCGWTGQPLVVRWDDETKNIMNLYPEKKAKSGLVEAIYATLDGHIYFYDLDDGSYTRDPIWIGMNFKGAGTLDPRGYPLMYVGSGLYRGGKAPCMFIISLIEGKVIYEQSGADSLRKRSWCAFDSAPLVNAQTDTIIWPGESGMLYTIKLNSVYDKAAGTVSVSPETTVKARYTTNLNRTLGFESSAVAVGENLYIADNGGMLFCVNANTMDLVWAQNTRDDVNATPVFEATSDGRGYLYTATSMEYGGGTSYIYKLDAATGDIIWERSYGGILYNKNVSGGVLASPVLGKSGTPLEGMIIYPVGKTNNSSGGLLVALNTTTGETVWEKKMSSYTWSSPCAVYASDGRAYIVVCAATGTMFLLDATTGETLSQVGLGSTIEASPVVFENTVIVGTRGQRVFGIGIS